MYRSFNSYFYILVDDKVLNPKNKILAKYIQGRNKIKMKKINIKYVHIAIIVLGILFICIPAFHSNLWFDESYSVAISNNHSFAEIWSIGGHDVHPVFYYWMLKIVSLIFGNKILCYRLLSVLSIALLGILGYTHIRKDFGEKVGAVFSLLVYTFPLNIVYAVEIRMYGWAMFFVMVMAIYAYRIFVNKKVLIENKLEKTDIKNWIIFGIFSLISAYTHYYGLMAAGIVNILLFIWLVKDAIKQKKFTLNLKAFLIQAVVEVLLYIPWILSLLLQMSQVSNGFWIGIKFPDTLIEMFTFQFTGNLGDTCYINNWVAGIYGIVFCLYIIYCVVKNKKSTNKLSLEPAKLAVSVYGLVILGAIAVSLIIWRPIIYARYLLVVTSLLIFTFSYIMAKVGNKRGNIAILILTVIVATIININLSQINYDKSNQEPINYLKENIQEGDIFVYGNEGSGFVISANFPEYMQYFYDQSHWGVEEAYKAYGPNMETVYDLSVLDDYKGRIWFVNAGEYFLLEEAQSKYDNLKVLKQAKFDVKYQKYKYSFALVEKY